MACPAGTMGAKGEDVRPLSQDLCNALCLIQVQEGPSSSLTKYLSVGMSDAKASRRLDEDVEEYQLGVS